MSFKKSSFCWPLPGCVEVDTDFKKSSHSFPVGCVDVKRSEKIIAVRNSKNQDGPVLEFTKEEWSAFIKGVKDGEFDT